MVDTDITTGENGLLHTLLRVKNLSHEKAIDLYIKELRADTFATDKHRESDFVFSEQANMFLRKTMQTAHHVTFGDDSAGD